MAEHSKMDFEHEFEDKLRRFDENIKIPEIPDVQNIFDKAETEKTNVIPFKKYSRYVAAAAAVVLICVCLPLISSGASLEFAPQEPVAMADIFTEKDNSFAEEAEIPAEPEMAFPEAAEEPVAEMPENEEDYDGLTNQTNDGVDYRYVLTSALEEFFSTNSVVQKDELKEPSSGMSSSVAEPETMTGDDLSLIELELNKKRSIEVSVEKDSVSVRLFDKSAGGEIISAFWVEGTFENAYKNGDYYVIKLSKTVSPEELEEGFYLPMVGDPVNGTYFIPEESVIIPEKITKGVISLSVEINIGTGEYKIYANLV